MKVMLGTHCEFCVKMLVKGLIVAIFTSSCIFSSHELVLHFRFHSFHNHCCNSSYEIYFGFSVFLYSKKVVSKYSILFLLRAWRNILNGNLVMFGERKKDGIFFFFFTAFVGM